jgi:hypothetical protein
MPGLKRDEPMGNIHRASRWFCVVGHYETLDGVMTEEPNTFHIDS